jgi:hypothetical protein
MQRQEGIHHRDWPPGYAAIRQIPHNCRKTLQTAPKPASVVSGNPLKSPVKRFVAQLA